MRMYDGRARMCDQMLLTSPAMTAASLVDGHTSAEDQRRSLGRPSRWSDGACKPTNAWAAGYSFQRKKPADGRPASPPRSTRR